MACELAISAMEVIKWGKEEECQFGDAAIFNRMIVKAPWIRKHLRQDPKEAREVSNASPKEKGLSRKISSYKAPEGCCYKRGQ